MTHRETLRRLLERAGFTHVAGWVRKEDAPAIRRKIEAAREDVEAAKTSNSEPDSSNSERETQ